jgi:hypothetical protein
VVAAHFGALPVDRRAKRFQGPQREKPGQYMFWIFIMSLMVLHFGGLAIVGPHFGK